MHKALEINNLKVSYGSIEALKGISIFVEEGQIIALLGSNGAGKTTTLRTISGVLDVLQGDIKFFWRRYYKITGK